MDRALNPSSKLKQNSGGTGPCRTECRIHWLPQIVLCVGWLPAKLSAGLSLRLCSPLRLCVKAFFEHRRSNRSLHQYLEEIMHKYCSSTFLFLVVVLLFSAGI